MPGLNQWPSLWMCWLLAACSPNLTWAQTPSRTSKPFASPAERCILPAAHKHGLNPQILRAILQVESSMRPDVVQRNANGSVDVGMAQINSIHFRELSQWGITPQKLLDPCVATHVAAWHLKRGLVRHGNTWFGVAAYHSVTPEHNSRYQNLVRKELMRVGALR
ncbi:MAG: lytic transglycosylase domain-containing protein [Limnohabitans sp.]|nr:lytic transglycosylase domain-containing protein [Limnohabitans sp.]